MYWMYQCIDEKNIGRTWYKSWILKKKMVVAINPLASTTDYRALTEINQIWI